MERIDQAKLFFERVHGPSVAIDRLISVWTLQDHRTRFFSDFDDAARYAVSRPESMDVYAGVGLYRPGITNGRGKAKDVVAITATWADIDHGDHHKKGSLPPNLDEAIKVIVQIGRDPSFIVHSGHGLQPWWLLKEPLRTEDGAADFARRWGAQVQTSARTIGYTVDSVFDLSRVMRVPGTFNNKAARVPVQLLQDGKGEIQ